MPVKQHADWQPEKIEREFGITKLESMSLLVDLFKMPRQCINSRNWFVIVLQGNEYAVSQALDITSNDLFQLFAILEFLKQEMIKLYQ